MLLSKIRKQAQIIVWLFSAFFAISIFYMFGSSRFNDAANNADVKNGKNEGKYMLEVGGEKVSTEIFNFRFKKVYENMKQKYEEAGMPFPETYEVTMVIKSQAAQSMLRETLLIQEAERRKITVADAELDSVIENERNGTVGGKVKPKSPSLPSRVRNYFDENKKTKQFRDGITQQGIDFKTYREIMRRAIMVDKVVKAISQELSTQEAKRVQEKAMGVWKKLATEDFSAVARQYSEDVGARENGGAWGAKTRADLDPALSDRAFNMKVGTFSEPIKTQEGFQIIKVIKREEAFGPEFNAQKDAIQAQLQKERGPKGVVTQRDIERAYEKVYLLRVLFTLKNENELVEQWAEKQKADKKIAVKVLDPELDAYMDFGKVDVQGKKAQAELDAVKKKYEALVKDDQTNENLYLMLGMIYEQKNRLLNDGLKKKKGVDVDDPYASPEDKMKAPESVKYLKEALESYTKAFELAEQNNRPDVSTMMGVAKVSHELGKGDGKDSRKYRAMARKYYTMAIDFSYTSPQNLGMIKEALTELKDEKGLKQVETAIADLEAQRAAPEEGAGQQIPVAPEQPEQGAEEKAAPDAAKDGKTPVEPKTTAPKEIQGGKPVSTETAKPAAPTAAKVPAKTPAPVSPK